MARAIVRGIIALSLVAALAQAVGAEPKLNLRLKLTPGQEFKMRQVVEKTTVGTVDNRAITVTEHHTLGFVFNVLKVDEDGVVTLRATFDKPSLSISGTAIQGFEQLAQAAGKGIAGLQGQSLTLTLGPNGAVRSLEGSAQCLQAAMRGVTGVPEPMRVIIQQMLAQLIDDQVLREGLASVFHILPDGPVAVDERWNRQVAVSTPGVTETSEVFFKVLESKDGVAKIKMYRQVKNAQSTTSLGVSFKMSGATEGVLEVDESTGLLKNGSYKLNLSGTAAAIGGGSAPVKITGSGTMGRY